MVVLSAAILTRSGKVLVARQFVSMSKLRIEGLLAAFPKLVGSGGQHTYIETENVRYLYQPIEGLYALLVTNKQSNIMEDLETLRLVAKLIPEYAHGQAEADVVAQAFPLVFALDEVISMGYRENLTLAQVRTFTEMDSHEEKLQKIIKESKELEAAKKAKEHAKEIDKRKAEMWKAQASAASAQGFGSSSQSQSSYSSSQQPVSEESISTIEREPVRAAPSVSRAQRAAKGGLGLQLGGKGGAKKNDFFAQLASEEHLPAVAAAPEPRAASAIAPSSSSPQAQAAAYRHVEGVLLTVDEVVRVRVERDGSLKKLEAQGTLKLTIGDPDLTKIEIQMSSIAPPKGTRFQPHPKVDRSAWSKSKRLALKTLGKGFPVGASNTAPILKWKLSTDDMDLCPLTLNFWPSQENGRMVVSVEYTCESENMTLSNASISIPCPGISSDPDITNVDGSTYFEAANGRLVWVIEGEIGSGDNGVLEFSCDMIDSDLMFPLMVSFSSNDTITGVAVDTVSLVEQQTPIDFESESNLTVDTFMME